MAFLQIKNAHLYSWLFLIAPYDQIISFKKLLSACYILHDILSSSDVTHGIDLVSFVSNNYFFSIYRLIHCSLDTLLTSSIHQFSRRPTFLVAPLGLHSITFWVPGSCLNTRAIHCHFRLATLSTTSNTVVLSRIWLFRILLLKVTPNIIFFVTLHTTLNCSAVFWFIAMISKP